MSDRGRTESLTDYARRQTVLIQGIVGPSPDPVLRAVADAYGVLCRVLAEHTDEAHRRIDALLAAETEAVRLYEGLRSGQSTLVDRIDELHRRLAATEQTASRAAMHSIPFGSARADDVSPMPILDPRDEDEMS